ncbi:MAG: carboxypeptidase regulatory-like domain-containing protein, partial [Ignavibacteria bacterium]|nr:carboxypeptidase regulatory-like domain-containing protein [Ignavibacteria bacterium]
MKKINILIVFLTLIGLNLMYAQVPSPTNLTAQFKQQNPSTAYGYVELKWQMPSTPGVNYLFKVFRQGPNDSSFKQIATSWRGLIYNDYNIRPNSTYSYYVVAFTASGTSAPSNVVTITTPPIPDVIKFVSIPPKVGSIGVEYTYDANATSNQTGAVISYSIVEGPNTATINSETGLLSWTPTASGYFKFKLKAQSNLGGVAYQEWTVKVSGPTGTITGLVKDETTNQPLENVAVYFLNTNAARHEVAYTNQNGEFSKTLIEGNYKIRFYKRGYHPEFYDNKKSIDSADVITVVPNVTAYITAALAKVTPPALYNISGSVLDANGNPIKSTVTAFIVRDTTFPIISPNVIPRNMTVVTDSLGNYQIKVVGGFEYVVYAKPFNRNYYPEFYDNKRTFQEADKILVNGNVSGINFVLEQKPVYNNGVAGLVKDFNTNAGVEAIVSAFKLTNGRFKSFKSVRTDSVGNYLIENLEPGKYILFAKPRPPYLPGYYKLDTVAFRWRDADTITITETGVVSGININLITRPDTGFAKVNGKVRTILGEPVSGVLVLAVNINGTVVAYTSTLNDGSYSFDNLTGGEYQIIAEATEYE